MHRTGVGLQGSRRCARVRAAALAAILGALACSAGTVHAQEMYRCKEGDKIVLQDMPFPGSGITVREELTKRKPAGGDSVGAAPKAGSGAAGPLDIKACLALRQDCAPKRMRETLTGLSEAQIESLFGAASKKNLNGDVLTWSYSGRTPIRFDGEVRPLTISFDFEPTYKLPRRAAEPERKPNESERVVFRVVFFGFDAATGQEIEY
jgi:hypothetical protein